MVIFDKQFGKFFWEKPYTVEERKNIFKHLWYVLLFELFLTLLFGLVFEAGLTTIFAMCSLMSMIVMLTYRIEINRDNDNQKMTLEMGALYQKMNDIENKLVKVKRK